MDNWKIDQMVDELTRLREFARKVREARPYWADSPSWSLRQLDGALDELDRAEKRITVTVPSTDTEGARVCGYAVARNDGGDVVGELKSGDDRAEKGGVK